MNFPALFANILSGAITVKYYLFFIGAIIEGPILFFISGILLKLNLVKLLPLFLALMAGDLVGDAIWYYIGYFLAEPAMRKNGYFIGLNPENLERVKKLFAEKHEKILFISKISLGFGTSMGTLAILMTAGITRTPFKKYILLNALGEMILLTIFLAGGYFFGQFYNSIAKDLKIGVIMGSLIIVTCIIYGFTRYIKSRKIP